MRTCDAGSAASPTRGERTADAAGPGVTRRATEGPAAREPAWSERVLIVAATDGELAPLEALLSSAVPARHDGGIPLRTGRLGEVPVAVASLGVGKVNTAWGLAALARPAPPHAVVQIGIGGAYAGAFLPVGSVACAAEEHDLDAGLRSVDGDRGMEALGFDLAPWAQPRRADRFPTDRALTAALARACGTAPQPFATSDGVSGDLDVAERRAERSGASVESMEGAAAAQVCLRMGLPFAEVRGISNVAGQREAQTWRAAPALQRCADAVRRGLGDWYRRDG